MPGGSVARRRHRDCKRTRTVRRTSKNTQLAYAGPVPSALLNRFVMLTDYVAADERLVACPNQDVAYGGGSVGLEVSPVVIQVPDFGNRFWVYQAVDARTDSFAKLGRMYGTKPGFYLLVGPHWQGDVPKGMPGFVSFKTFRADDGERVSVIEFESEEALRAWREHPEHRKAQELGRSAFYAESQIRVCSVIRQYGFKRSKA
jgi:hypothetical protein